MMWHQSPHICWKIVAQRSLCFSSSALRYTEQGSPSFQFPTMCCSSFHPRPLTVSHSNLYFCYQASSNSSSPYPLSNFKATSAFLSIYYRSIPETSEAKREAWNRSFPRGFRGSMAFLMPWSWILFLVSRKVTQLIPVFLSYSVCSTFIQQP